MQKIKQKVLTLLEQNVPFSDLHLAEGEIFTYREHGELKLLDDEYITKHAIREFISDILGADYDIDKRLEEKGGQDDKSFTLHDSRFRLNLFWYKGSRLLSMVLRKIPSEILSIADLGLPPHIVNLVDRDNGMVLVTGQTGSGKSTTLSALVDHINTTKRKVIITQEDPIEAEHVNKNSIIYQRQIGDDGDCTSFHKALRAALRQDPDVILVGEIRDKETMEIAMQAAETGHLVLCTLHTSSAVKTIERVMDFFPGDEKEHARKLLASVLVAVFSQTLVKKKAGGGRVCCFEMMKLNDQLRSIIREGKLQQIQAAIETPSDASDRQYMQTMNKTLKSYAIAELISKEDAIAASPNPETLITDLMPVRR